MNEPFETTTDDSEPPQAEPTPRPTSVLLSIVKPLGCIAGGVGVGLLVAVGVMCFLLFVVAPALLEWVANFFGS